LLTELPFDGFSVTGSSQNPQGTGWPFAPEQTNASLHMAFLHERSSAATALPEAPLMLK